MNAAYVTDRIGSLLCFIRAERVGGFERIGGQHLLPQRPGESLHFCVLVGRRDVSIRLASSVQSHLVVGKRKEGFILNDRTVEGAAELVSDVMRFGTALAVLEEIR